MTVAAGIDIGNATTEVVIARLGADAPEVVASGRAPTRRTKGSPESLDGAAQLLRRLERQRDVRVEVAAAAPLRPVATMTAALPEPAESTGRLAVVAAGADTAGGRGYGVGRPCLLGAEPAGSHPVVVVVPSGVGYRSAVTSLQALLSEGRLAAVLLADDEGVLVANRLGRDVPVVDEVDVEAALACDLLAVEVSDRPGLRSLGDPLRLVSQLDLDSGERPDAARLAARLQDTANAVVGRRRDRNVAPPEPAGWVQVGELGRLPFPQAHPLLAAGAVGLAQAFALPPGDGGLEVDDLWTVDLWSVADTVLTRAGGARSRAVGLAALRADAPYADPSGELAHRLGVPVRCAQSESLAGRLGALSTPGSGADAVVVDLGAGTVDVISTAASVVAAGGGDLLSASVAALTGSSQAAAEWVKRGPAQRVEAPQILLDEGGGRDFLDRPAPPETVGALVVSGPTGLLPFSRVLSPGEWRALRLRLKVDSIGGNVARALRTLDQTPATVVVVGGPAGDDEVLGAVSRALPAGTAVGRGNVGGELGHRYAVAYGLLTAAAAAS